MAIEAKPGDPILFYAQKITRRPGPRAQDIVPSKHGDTYSYRVEKYWRVREVREDGALRLYTRGGKEHVFGSDDRRLQKPGILKRIIQGKKFPPIQ